MVYVGPKGEIPRSNLKIYYVCIWVLSYLDTCICLAYLYPNTKILILVLSNAYDTVLMYPIF